MKNIVPLLIAALLIGCLIPTASSISAADPSFISGRAVNGGGQPLADVNISASNTSTGMTYYSHTNDTGVYNISLPTGSYNVSASKVNYSGNVTYHDLTVGPNILSGIDFTMNEILGRVFGFITSGDVSVGGVTVTLSNNQLNFHSESELPFGQYSIEGISPGVYVAKAEKTGYWTAYAQDPVIVTRGNSVQVNFSMDVQPARVFGTVTIGGEPAVDVKVELLLAGTVYRQAQTDSTGNYSFANLQSGEYQLRLSKEGLVEKTVPVSLAPFEDKRVDQIMARSPVEGLQGFIGNLDLTHSLMIVAMLVTVALMAFAIFIRMRSIKKPDMLANEKKEEEEREEKKKKK